MRAYVAGAWVAIVCLFSQVVVLHANSQSPSSAVKLRVAQCIPVPPQQRAWLGEDWERFLPFVHSCEVKRQKSRPIFVLSVWAEQFEATLPKGAPAERLPKPLIASSDGKVLGRLPVGFPDDPPRSSEISFSNWVRGFPRKIRIVVNDPTVTGDRTLVLEWNPESGSYVSKKTKP
jgi:hypothetical protein